MAEEGDGDLEKRGHIFLWKFAGTIALLFLAISAIALLKLFEEPITPWRLWGTAAGIFNGFMLLLGATIFGVGLKQALSPPFIWRFLALILVGIAVLTGLYYAGLSFFHAQLGNEQSRPGGWVLLFLAAISITAILAGLGDLLTSITQKRGPPDPVP